MLRKLLTVDHKYARWIAREAGFEHFPAEFREEVFDHDGVDLVEALISVVQHVPSDDSAESLATIAAQVEGQRCVFESHGWRSVLCPSKRSGDGYKQSDDQWLAIETILTAMRIRPDFVVLFAGDGDFAPLVWGLRREGIRTEVIASEMNLASELRRAAFNIIDADNLLSRLSESH